MIIIYISLFVVPPWLEFPRLPLVSIAYDILLVLKSLLVVNSLPRWVLQPCLLGPKRLLATKI